MIDFSKFLHFHYWFGGIPTEFYWVKYITAIFVFLFICGIIVKIFSKKRISNRFYRRFFKELYNPLFIFSIIGLTLTFFRYENVNYLSIRFLFLLLLIIFVIWLSYKIFELRVLYPKVECEYKQQEDKNKYRPAPKNKKKKHKKR